MNQHLQKLQAEIQELKIKLTAPSATNDCGTQTEHFVKGLAIQYQDTLSKTNSVQNMDAIRNGFCYWLKYFCCRQWRQPFRPQRTLLRTMKTTFQSSKNSVADHEDNLFVLKGQLSLKPHEIQDQVKQSTLKSSMLTEWRPKDILRKTTSHSEASYL